MSGTNGNTVQEIEKRLENWTEPLYEAPVSVTIKLDFRGYDTMLTIRGHSGGDVLEKLNKAIDYLEKHGARPTGGSGSGGSEPAAAGQGQVQEIDPAWCSIHNCEMRRREKDGQVWYSHKAPDGAWCRGR